MSARDDCPPIRDRLDLPRWLCQKGLTGKGAELGVLFGEYSAHLLEYWTGHLYLIDPWVQQPVDDWLDGCNAVNMPKAYAKTLNAVAPYSDRVTILRLFSQHAAAAFQDGELDWIFLDHNHSLEVMRADLPRYWAKVRPGGLMGGHDFYDRHDDWHDCGVRTAVEEFCQERGLRFYTTACTSWWVEKV